MSYFYAIQLAPDLAPGRLKLGYSNNPASRLASHRCAAPTARLLGVWPCASMSDEYAAIQAITSQCGGTQVGAEVFDFPDIDRVLASGDIHFGCESAPSVDVPRVPKAPDPVREAKRAKAVERRRENHRKFKEYVDKVMAVGIGLEEMAEACGVSRNTLARARMDPDSAGYRPPPRNWKSKIRKVVLKHAKEMQRIADVMGAYLDANPHLRCTKG